jgi:hypothetical protein
VHAAVLGQRADHLHMPARVASSSGES